jgi:hypothetical protein
MAIVVQCGCGKRMGLADATAGKTVKCPACGNSIAVPAGSAGAAPVAGGRRVVKEKSASPAVYISLGKIVAAAVLLIVVVSGIMFYLGPVRVWNQWEAIAPQANGDVKDVITFALQAYLSQNGYYDPARPHDVPNIDGIILFYRPVLAMSMPEKIKFEGKSSQGDFSGFYNTQTGDIEADVSYGGMTVAGMVDLAKSQGTFHITGRDVDHHQPEAESNGQKLEIYYPPQPTMK